MACPVGFQRGLYRRAEWQEDSNPRHDCEIVRHVAKQDRNNQHHQRRHTEGAQEEAANGREMIGEVTLCACRSGEPVGCRLRRRQRSCMDERHDREHQRVTSVFISAEQTAERVYPAK